MPSSSVLRRLATTSRSLRLLSPYLRLSLTSPSAPHLSANRRQHHLHHHHVSSTSCLPAVSLLAVLSGEDTTYVPPQSQYVLSDALPADVRQLSQTLRQRLQDLVDLVADGEPHCEDGARLTLCLTAANVFVYGAWKTLPFSFMTRNFINSVDAMRAFRFWTALTSTFSHMKFPHLLLNMYALNRFGPELVSALSSSHFMVFYLTSGLSSSLLSLLHRLVVQRPHTGSLGASGSITALVWLHSTIFPTKSYSLLFTDSPFFPLIDLLIVQALVEATLLCLAVRRIDFAAHLAGALFATVWFAATRDFLVQTLNLLPDATPHFPLVHRVRHHFDRDQDQDQDDRPL